mgnify:CR=1 FL=1
MSSLALTKNTFKTHQPFISYPSINRWHSNAQLGETNFYLSRCDDERYWQSATLGDLTCMLSGRIVLSKDQWLEAETHSSAGGLACRWVLNLLIEEGIKALTKQLNGNFCACIINAELNETQIITDRCGANPIFNASCYTTGLLVGTDLDVLAKQRQHLSAPLTFDKCNMAEVLVTGGSSAPFTHYSEISELEPATCYRFDINGKLLDQQVYWQPTATKDSECEDDHLLASQLATAIKNAVNKRTHRKTGLLLSGGADSRALLFGANTPSNIETATFFDQPNPELDIAKQLAQAAGAKHIALQRDFDHYGNAAKEVVAMCNGMWSIKDIHYHGFYQQLSSQGWDSVMTGCYADYLVKGLPFNTKPVAVLGKQTPLKQLAPYQREFYQPHAAIDPHWQAKAYERSEPSIDVQRAAKENPSVLEDYRVRPMSREPDAMGRLYCLRALPWDPVLLDNDILEFYSRLSPSQKLNSKVFRLAVHEVVGDKAAHIKNNNDGVPLNASNNMRIAKYFQHRFYDKARRGWRKLFPNKSSKPPLATNGSWPNFCLYVKNSQVIEDLWSEPTDLSRAILTELMGSDPWHTDLNTWSDDDHIDLFLRLITLKIWLEECAIESANT